MTGSVHIGVIGGSGLYNLFDEGTVERLDVDTPYGAPSGPITLGTVHGKRVAFLPRHGENHAVAPHRINYRANVWALASLGVRALLSSSAVGGLHPGCPPGAFVVPDQFIDRTWGRPDTYYNDDVHHLAAAEPYCPQLRALAVTALRDSGAHTVLPTGTVVVIQGPRFSTRAESRWLESIGGDIVNMTQYPEVVLAAELNLGSATIAFVTDSDAQDPSANASHEAVSADLVFARLAEAQPVIRSALVRLIRDLPVDYAPPPRLSPDAVRTILGRTS